ncbi:Imm50 family immunity protein [Bacillus wiedmannii]|uniref:Imm50 family immunity protein n=1 Tax=Bacillus wiedmannii TaxID=1890302 RepID=UPI00094AD9AC|nr:Imm50 family immunity protein [Bacillus wiedmannii]MBZ4222686.1 immunity 50 family protein [Bacillus wiedmannii]MDI6676468.1 Imm50 family immunity protein [Bacillus wiedmannii]
MWYSNLEGSRFISNLYNEAPSLSDVRIVAVKIEDEGKKISVNFNIPKFADNPPKKWEDLNYNTVFVQLDFFDIQELTLKSSNNKYRGDINIELDKDGKFNINILGSVCMNLKADYGIIQSVSGYIDTME